jgi:amino acid transporter
LYIDAFISPAGTGQAYMGTTARLSYALAREGTVPRRLAALKPRGVPLASVLLAFVFGEIAFLPFPSWQSLVGLVTLATAIMYAFAPVSLTALRRRDPDRRRPYRLPAAAVSSPLAFISANLIVYWSGFEAQWKILAAIAVGYVILAVTLARTPPAERPDHDWRPAAWVAPWLVGLTLIGWLGRYGNGALKWLPNWWDLVVVIAFSLVIFYWAVHDALDSDRVHAAIEAERHELESGPELAVG